MRTGRARIVVLAAVIGLPPTFARAQTLPDLASECARRLDAAVVADPPPTAGTQCPELLDALGGSPWRDLVTSGTAPENWQSPQLERLAAGLEPYTSPTVPRSLEPAALERIVADWRPFEPVATPSLWERIAAWLDDWLGGENGGESGWLRDWLEALSLPPSFAKTLMYALAAVLVLAAVGFVVNELRLAGVFGERAARARWRAVDAGGTATGARAWMLTDLERAPPRRQPGILLGLLVSRARGRLRRALGPTLTHAELVAAAADLDAPRRDVITSVSRAAERATYGGWTPSREELAELRARGLGFIEQGDAEEDGDT